MECLTIFSLMNIDEEAFSTDFNPDEHIKSRADKWIITKLQYLIKDVTLDMEKYRYSDAGNKNYNFTWCELCDWYVEFSKGRTFKPGVLLLF